MTVDEPLEHIADVVGTDPQRGVSPTSPPTDLGDAQGAIECTQDRGAVARTDEAEQPPVACWFRRLWEVPDLSEPALQRTSQRSQAIHAMPPCLGIPAGDQMLPLQRSQQVTCGIALDPEHVGYLCHGHWANQIN